MKILILILVLMVIVILSLIYFFCIICKSNTNKSNFINGQHNINFYDHKQAHAFILEDKDHYIKNMSNYDLIARLNASNEKYKILSANDMLEFTTIEKNKLLYLMNKVKLSALGINSLGINFIKIGNIYENGFPHTRENIILIPYTFFLKDEKEQLNTLTHECIHIYQRYNPIETESILNKYGFKKIGNFSMLFPNEYKSRRSNPDLDENIWQDPNGELMFPIFSILPPTSMNDITNDKMEHPYEWMAYNSAYFV